MYYNNINYLNKMDFKYIYIVDTFRIGEDNSIYAFDTEEKCYKFLKELYPSYSDKNLKIMVKKSILLSLLNEPQKFNINTNYITFGYIQMLFEDSKYYYYDVKENFIKDVFSHVNRTINMLLEKHKDVLSVNNKKKNNKNYPEKSIVIKKYNETQITTIHIKNYLDDTYILVENLPIT